MIAEFVKGSEVTGWNGILATVGIPLPIVDRLYQAIKKSIKTVEFSDRLKQEGAIGVASTPVEFQEIIKKDIDKWNDVIQKAGIHAK